MNKFLALAILSTTVALGAASAEAATYYGPRQPTVVEGRNAADFFAARNGAAAINQQSELNARQTR